MGKGNFHQGRGGGRGHPRQNKYDGNYNASPTTATKTHGAITKGLEMVFFTFGNSKDAAEFEKKNDSQSIRFATCMARFQAIIARDG